MYSKVQSTIKVTEAGVRFVLILCCHPGGITDYTKCSTNCSFMQLQFVCSWEG